MNQTLPCNWSYLFSDGSRLVGRVCGELDRERNCLLNPTQIKADYFDEDGKTILGSWRDRDFACFDLDVDGKEIVIVASNDCFVANSLCLVFCRTRNRVQVTDWGSQLIGEPFNPSAWSFTSVTFAVSELNWSFTPMLLAFSCRFTWQLPHSQTIYRWAFSPFLPFYSGVQLEVQGQVAQGQGA